MAWRRIGVALGLAQAWAEVVAAIRHDPWMLAPPALVVALCLFGAIAVTVIWS